MKLPYTPNQLVLYLSAFLLGFALMSFEMLGSRYLYPYYGGSIETWASLISVVLAALTIGYFVGGFLVDKFPSISLLGFLVLLSALFLAAIPMNADRFLIWLVENLGDGPLSILTASCALLLIPLSLLGAYSPFAIHLAAGKQGSSGIASGMIYGISTVGNILGTLSTTFYLIPRMGTRFMTYCFASLIACVGIALIVWSFKHNNAHLKT
jgi:hypothetical protein